jgi:hypothetical protein
MRANAWLIATVVVLAAAAAPADILINTDFDTSSAGWTLGGPNSPVIAGAAGAGGNVLADANTGAGLWSYNTTPLPLELAIDLDYRITEPYSPQPLVIGFHVWGSQEEPLSQVTGPLLDHNGYYIVFTGGEAPPQQRIQIVRRGGPNPEDLTVLAEDQFPNGDMQVHHLRITDCGCGRLNIYVDNMDLPFLYTDNKYGYIGRQGTLLGVGMPGASASWIDNVIVEGAPVPEPGIALLLIIGGLAQVARRLRQ